MKSSRSFLLVLSLAGLAAAVTVPARAQGIHVGVRPALTTVAPGATVNLEVDVTQAGTAFNAFTLVVSYDPSALTLLPASPITNQDGCLMTGGCSSVCGVTFNNFSYAADSLIAYVSLLCNGDSLTGPGQIYKLQFQASNTAQVTNVHVRAAQFYQAGRFVGPVFTDDAQVGIGTALGVDPASSRALRLVALPNPSSGPLAFDVASPADGAQSLDVLDLSGRLVRHLEQGWRAKGARRIAWDGTNEAGTRLPAGVYLVRLRAAGRALETRVVLIR